MATLEMSMPPFEKVRGVDYTEEVMSFLRYGWPPKLTDAIRVVKFKKGYTGTLFDLWEDKVEMFMDFYVDLKGKGQDEGVDIKRCTQLPELEEEDEALGAGNSYGGGWRTGGGGGDSYGGGAGRGFGGGGRGGYGG